MMQGMKHSKLCPISEGYTDCCCQNSAKLCPVFSEEQEKIIDNLKKEELKEDINS